MEKNKVFKNKRFWFKLIIAILPLISILIFFAGQASDLLSDKQQFWNNILKDRTDEFGEHPYFLDWSTSQNIGYLLSRNIFMLTTLGNVLACAFFINSALNNNNEGKGKFDNYKYGLMIINTLSFIVIFYNGSLLFTNAVSMMKWYNYVSWMLEHSIPQIIMVVYLIGFYNKDRDETPETRTKSYRIKKWWKWMLISLVPVLGYHIFFTALGYVLQAADAMPIFGDMSTTGYFPYSYLDFTSTNKSIPVKFLKPWSQFVGTMVLIIVEQIVMFSIVYSVNEHKIDKKNRSIFKQGKINSTLK